MNDHFGANRLNLNATLPGDAGPIQQVLCLKSK